MKRISLFLPVLLLLLSCTDENHYERLLCHFEECNRNDIPLSVDSVLPIVRHYDHPWHSRLHRLRAYYMLGSAYRDQGETPAALIIIT